MLIHKSIGSILLTTHGLALVDWKSSIRTTANASANHIWETWAKGKRRFLPTTD